MRYVQGNTKRCNGTLHKGKYIPLDQFWIHKSGKRIGKPFSQCKECMRFYKHSEHERGTVPWDRVKFVFDELIYRLGKMEAMRRIGVSPNYVSRREREKFETVRRPIAARAMRELQKCRENDEVRHRKSIRYGASVRGTEEREIKRSRDYYNTVDVRKLASRDRELLKYSLTE